MVSQKVHKIVFLDRATIGPGVTISRPDFEYAWQDYAQTNSNQVVERLTEANIAITNKVPIDAAALQVLPQLKFIAVAATGYNVIDLEACKVAGVAVSNIRGYAQHTVPEHTFSMILSLRRNLFEYREQVAAGVWQESDQFCFFNRPIRDLHGSTLGILGTGNIAAEVGRIGEAFGMTVNYHSLSGRTDTELQLVDLDTLVTTSDILSVHCPLTEDSDGLINHEVFAKMKNTAILINTSRGQIVVTDDLALALERGQIVAAGIDVVEQEPPPLGSSMMRLTALPNMLLTPHIGWASVEAMQVLADQLIENLNQFVSGQPQNLV